MGGRGTIALWVVGATALALGLATTGVAFYQAAVTADFCRKLCSPSEHRQLDEFTNAQCEQGCKFFKVDMNLKRLADKTSYLNLTKDQCYQLCSDAYDEEERIHCFSGCSKMLQFQKAIWMYLEQRVETEGMLEVEVSLVSDPALWKPDVGYHGVYKVPQTVIRTMPLQPELSEVIDGKNWTPCSSQRSDIPLWIVAVIAIALTIFTLYVSFILPSRNDEETIYRNLIQEDYMYEGDDVRKDVDGYYQGIDLKKDGADTTVVDLHLMTMNEFLIEDYHKNIIPPPKYTLLPVDDNRED